MVNLCIDQGNSSVKTGVFNNHLWIDGCTYEKLTVEILDEIILKFHIDNCILSTVTNTDSRILSYLEDKLNFFINLNHETPVPIENRYATPETLGKDRLAAVVGAVTLKPATDLLVIDAGTAITYDFVNSQGVYTGGNIAPGVEMRLKSLHDYTKRLPLVNFDDNVDFLFGNSTDTAILAGVINGVLFEIDGYINTLKHKFPELSAFLTGGSTFYIDNKLKNAIFAEKNLVLIGLNRILQFNV